MPSHRSRSLVAAVLTLVGLAATGCTKPTDVVEPPVAVSTSGGGVVGDASPTATATPAPAATGGGPVEDLPASWTLCQNQLRGSSMGYPGDWFTTSLGASDKCSLFHETSFTIAPNSEYPLVAMTAIQIDMTLADYVAGITAPSDAVTLLKENTTVAGKAAVRFETKSVQEGLYDVGTRRYGYAIDRGSRVFVLSTLAVPSETRYNSWKFVVDTAKGTLRFL
jgi:hypothetical protein